jgi:hypothetical protein
MKCSVNLLHTVTLEVCYISIRINEDTFPNIHKQEDLATKKEVKNSEPRFGCAGCRSIRGKYSTRQIQRLYLALLGSGPVDGHTAKFLSRYLFYYKNNRSYEITSTISTHTSDLSDCHISTATLARPIILSSILIAGRGLPAKVPR